MKPSRNCSNQDSVCKLSLGEVDVGWPLALFVGWGVGRCFLTSAWHDTRM